MLVTTMAEKKKRIPMVCVTVNDHLCMVKNLSELSVKHRRSGSWKLRNNFLELPENKILFLRKIKKEKTKQNPNHLFLSELKDNLGLLELSRTRSSADRWK